MVTPTSNSSSRRQLSFDERLKLYKWISKNHERITSNNMTWDQAAEIASKELEILSLNRGHIKTILPSLSKNPFNVHLRKKEDPKPKQVRFVDLEARAAIAELYRRLGEKPPADILPDCTPFKLSPKVRKMVQCDPSQIPHIQI